MKRIIIRVQWVKLWQLWRIALKGAKHPGTNTLKCRKQDAIAEAISLAWYFDGYGRDSQVVSHRKDGVIQWERTYPRSSDPRRSKG